MGDRFSRNRDDEGAIHEASTRRRHVGGGKGVCTTLAISNAIINLSGSYSVWGAIEAGTIGSLEKIYVAPQNGMVLSASDSIVELIPSLQEFPASGSKTFEVMVARPHSDLYMNLIALKMLDSMLLGMLDGFRDTEFPYIDRGILVPDANNDNSACPSSFSGRPSLREEEKWWLPLSYSVVEWVV